MVAALIAIVIVIALVAGVVLSLLKSAKTGMPSQDVLDRAAARREDEQNSRD